MADGSTPTKPTAEITDIASRIHAKKKARVNEMAKAAIINIDKTQREQDEKNEDTFKREALKRDLTFICFKAYQLFPTEVADKILIEMLPFVQSAVKLSRS